MTKAMFESWICGRICEGKRKRLEENEMKEVHTNYKKIQTWHKYTSMNSGKSQG